MGRLDTTAGAERAEPYWPPWWTRKQTWELEYFEVRTPNTYHGVLNLYVLHMYRPPRDPSSEALLRRCAEFCAFWSIVWQEAVLSAFNRLDADGSGSISPEDLRHVIGETFEGAPCEHHRPGQGRSGHQRDTVSPVHSSATVLDSGSVLGRGH